MEGKRTRKRKTSARPHNNGRSEGKPKVSKAEVTKEKEENDRLEAASVLSSLMYLPPKSSADQDADDEPSESSSKSATSTSSVTYFSPDSGIPTQSLPHHAQGDRGRVTCDWQTLCTMISEIEPFKSQMGQLSSKTLNLKPSELQFLSQTTGIPAETILKLQELQSKKILNMPSSSAAKPSKLPVTVNPGITVNKTVASALRQAVSNNMKNPINSDNGKSKPGEIQPSVADNSEGEEKKKESTESTLPLKKRRLIGVKDSLSDAASMPDMRSKLDSLSSGQLQSLMKLTKSSNTAKASLVSSTDTHKSPDEGYKAVKFDPRMSLMVLQDIRQALTPDEDGDLPIHVAVVHENSELVQKFIEIMGMSGKTVDRFNKLQQTPLHLAILVNHPDMVQSLLMAGANPNLPDRLGRTSVHLAVCKEFTKCLHTIFTYSKYRAFVNTRNYEGYLPLHTCVELDNLPMMQYLVDKEADVNAQDGKAGRSIVFYATEYQRRHLVEYLLDNHASAELQNYAGTTPLMTAQSAGLEDIGQLLKKSMDIYVHEETLCTQSKKIPIPRIPSKSTLITNEHTGMRSRSNSQDGRTLSRQSSTGSNSSPMDLSIQGSLQRSATPPTLPTKPRVKGYKKLKRELSLTEHSTSSSMVKQKHASLLARLEGKFVDRNSLNEMQVMGDEPSVRRDNEAAAVGDRESMLAIVSDPNKRTEFPETDGVDFQTCHPGDKRGMFVQTKDSPVLQRHFSGDKSTKTVKKKTRKRPDSQKSESMAKSSKASTMVDTGHVTVSHESSRVTAAKPDQRDNLLSTSSAEKQFYSSVPSELPSNLASNFADLLKSISGPLNKLDVLDMVKDVNLGVLPTSATQLANLASLKSLFGSDKESATSKGFKSLMDPQTVSTIPSQTLSELFKSVIANDVQTKMSLANSAEEARLVKSKLLTKLKKRVSEGMIPFPEVSNQSDTEETAQVLPESTIPHSSEHTTSDKNRSWTYLANIDTSISTSGKITDVTVTADDSINTSISDNQDNVDHAIEGELSGVNASVPNIADTVVGARVTDICRASRQSDNELSDDQQDSSLEIAMNHSKLFTNTDDKVTHSGNGDVHRAGNIGRTSTNKESVLFERTQASILCAETANNAADSKCETMNTEDKRIDIGTDEASRIQEESDTDRSEVNEAGAEVEGETGKPLGTFIDKVTLGGGSGEVESSDEDEDDAECNLVIDEVWSESAAMKEHTAASNDSKQVTIEPATSSNNSNQGSTKHTANHISKQVEHTKVDLHDNIAHIKRGVDQVEDSTVENSPALHTVATDGDGLNKTDVTYMKYTKVSKKSKQNSPNRTKSKTNNVGEVGSRSVTPSDLTPEMSTGETTQSVTVTSQSLSDVTSASATYGRADTPSKVAVTPPVTEETSDVSMEGTNHSVSEATSVLSSSESLPSVSDMVKQGKSHTLYYKDGKGFKPIKIFIDDSEQSSIVLQRMLAATHLTTQASASNSDTALASSISQRDDSENISTESVTSVKSTADSMDVSEPLLHKVEVSAPLVNKEPTENVSTHSPQSDKYKSRPPARKIATIPSPHKSTSKSTFQNVYIDSLNVSIASVEPVLPTMKLPSITAKNMLTNATKIHAPVQVEQPVSSPELTATKLLEQRILPTSNTSHQTNDDNTSSNVVGDDYKTIKHPVITMPERNSSKLIANSDAKSSEGTLTKVNPDIKSRLSKALQSPQRKASIHVATTQEVGSIIPNTESTSYHGNHASLLL